MVLFAMSRVKKMLSGNIPIARRGRCLQLAPLTRWHAFVTEQAKKRIRFFCFGVSLHVDLVPLLRVVKSGTPKSRAVACDLVGLILR